MISTTAQHSSLQDGVQGTILNSAERHAADQAHRRLSQRLLQTQDEERRRIARELHDSVGQYLASMEMSLSGALDSSSEIPASARRLLSDCLAIVRRCSNETRTMSQLLHPPLLEVMGLAAAVLDYVNGFSKRSGIGVRVDIAERLPRIERDVETAVLRIVQESLMNVYRHSGSRHATVRVACDAGHCMVEVEDFGHGIPAGVLEGRAEGGEQLGVGLQGMRCRVEQLSGSLEIRSDDDGTLVRAVFPSVIRRDVDARSRNRSA